MRFRPGIGPTLFALVAIPILLAFGFWQLERARWKEDLIARIEARLAAAPVPVTTLDALPAEEFTRVRLVGRFVGDQPMFLAGRTYEGKAGWHILSPFALTDGGWVVVDRGWVPMAAREADAADAPAENSVENTTVDGVLRLPPEAGLFTPDNDPAGNTWFRVDPGAMAQASGIAPADHVAAAYVAAAPAPGGTTPAETASAETTGDGTAMRPVATGDRFSLPRNHFQYALTWFGLAATLAGVYLAYGLSRGRPEADHHGHR